MGAREKGLRAWARDAFGTTGGHAATAARWVEMAIGAARHPSGKVTTTFRAGAARTAAYRQLERESLTPADVLDGPAKATVRACAAEPYVFVPTDGTSATLTDPARSKGTGPLGSRRFCARGHMIASAVAVDARGVPVGLAGLSFWARPEKSSKIDRHQRRLGDKETSRYLRLCQQIHERFQEGAPATRPWFQLDRGLDFRELLDWAVRKDVWVTVRAQHDRCVRNEPFKHLYAAIVGRGVRMIRVLNVPPTRHHLAGTAVMDVFTGRIELALQDRRTGRKYSRFINVVLARENGTAVRGEPLEWLLLTTHPIDTVEDIELVLAGYAARWRVEDFHSSWKGGLCHIEESQLRSPQAFAKWATLVAVVAVRAERLTHLSRQTPDVEAGTEFDQDEVDAVILLRRPRGSRPGDRPTLGQVVRWIADLGGYTGKSSGGPPGKIVIGRGLLDVEAVAKALKTQREIAARAKK